MLLKGWGAMASQGLVVAAVGILWQPPRMRSYNCHRRNWSRWALPAWQGEQQAGRWKLSALAGMYEMHCEHARSVALCYNYRYLGNIWGQWQMCAVLVQHACCT